MRTLGMLLALPFMVFAYAFALFFHCIAAIGFGGLLKLMTALFKLMWIPMKILLMSFGLLTTKHNKF